MKQSHFLIDKTAISNYTLVMTAYECQHQSIPGLTLYLQQFLEFTYYLSSKINVSVLCVISKFFYFT